MVHSYLLGAQKQNMHDEMSVCASAVSQCVARLTSTSSSSPPLTLVFLLVTCRLACTCRTKVRPTVQLREEEEESAILLFSNLEIQSLVGPNQ
jgi:hypothetical protein